MKFNKNIMAFAFCLAMSCPVKPEESTEETIATEMISEIAQDAISIITSANTQELVNEADAIVNNVITTSEADAVTLLEEFTQNLNEGSKFQINGVTYVIETTTKAMNTQEETIITTIATDVVDSALSTIANEIQASQTHTISQTDAVTLLQAGANSLVAGSHFALNGTTYTVEASQN